MPTSLSNFEAELNRLHNAQNLTNVMETCQNNFFRLNTNSSYNDLSGHTCLIYRNNKYYNTADDSLSDYTELDTETNRLVAPYTYYSLETKAFSLANVNINTAENAASYAVDLSYIKYNTDNSSNRLFYDTDDRTKNLYSDMVPNRRRLDRKMRHLYGQSNNGPLSDVELQYENGIIVNLTWTVLATCILYFLFVKL